MVLENSDFHARKNFSANYPQFGHMPSKRSTALFQAEKKFKKYRSDGAPNI
jgi:hypothetical protein